MAVIDKRETYGRYLEEFKVGDIIKHWPGRTITEFDDTLFALITQNQHPLHIDAHYASQTQFKQRLVVGYLPFCIAVGQTVADISGKAIANLEYEKVEHVGPCFHGDTIYSETEILDVKESRSKPDRGVVYVETRGYNQNGELIVRFRRRVLIPRRPKS